MSRAERFALAGALILVVLHAGVVASPSLGAALEYQHAALRAEPWRLLTGHWAHINWPHVLINAAAWFIVARLFAQELSPARQSVVMLITSVAISCGLAWIFPAIAWYRGFSGLLHGLFFAGAAAWLMAKLTPLPSRNLKNLWLPAALLFGGWVKVLLEQPALGATPYAQWLGAPTVPQAHLLGAACGTIYGFAVGRVRASATAASVRQHSE